MFSPIFEFQADRLGVSLEVKHGAEHVQTPVSVQKAASASAERQGFEVLLAKSHGSMQYCFLKRNVLLLVVCFVSING